VKAAIMKSQFARAAGIVAAALPSAKLTGWSENLLIGVGPNLQVPSATDS